MQLTKTPTVGNSFTLTHAHEKMVY